MKTSVIVVPANPVPHPISKISNELFINELYELQLVPTGANASLNLSTAPIALYPRDSLGPFFLEKSREVVVNSIISMSLRRCSLFLHVQSESKKMKVLVVYHTNHVLIDKSSLILVVLPW